ncbi:lantibiotic dehydratase [Streptomyces sp. ISL-44]|nr:lantibiotic dehydratase [Streptomyces sp. ISL-44]
MKPAAFWPCWCTSPRRPARRTSSSGAIRDHEVGIHTSAEDGPARYIPLDQLALRVTNGRFALIWDDGTGELREVSVCSGHMLNNSRAPAICRLLADVSRDGTAQIVGLDWGQARDFPYLPRVTPGLVILRLAQWRIGHATAHEMAGQPDRFLRLSNRVEPGGLSPTQRTVPRTGGSTGASLRTAGGSVRGHATGANQGCRTPPVARRGRASSCQVCCSSPGSSRPGAAARPATPGRGLEQGPAPRRRAPAGSPSSTRPKRSNPRTGRPWH